MLLSNNTWAVSYGGKLQKTTRTISCHSQYVTYTTGGPSIKTMDVVGDIKECGIMGDLSPLLNNRHC